MVAGNLVDVVNAGGRTYAFSRPPKSPRTPRVTTPTTPTRRSFSSTGSPAVFFGPNSDTPMASVDTSIGDASATPSTPGNQDATRAANPASAVPVTPAAAATAPPRGGGGDSAAPALSASTEPVVPPRSSHTESAPNQASANNTDSTATPITSSVACWHLCSVG
jgi:hypothetical protein